jgi:hypothetical protein
MLFVFIVVAYFVLYVLALSKVQFATREYHEQQTELGPQLSLSAWIVQEKHVALHRLLQNIAPFGENAVDAAAGSVIASPSKHEPNYYYQCTTPISVVDCVNMNRDKRCCNYIVDTGQHLLAKCQLSALS